MLDYTNEQMAKYQDLLSLVASLSGLFSDNPAPMIYYRATENIYCEAFDAENVSRSDCTADAIFVPRQDPHIRCGVGIKTFLYDGRPTFQKIAEFNRQQPLFRNLEGIELIRRIAQLRNERIETTIRTYGLNRFVYHCILRETSGNIKLVEEALRPIDIDKIEIQTVQDNKIIFTDGNELYEFYHSKSTLFKCFSGDNFLSEFHVDILEDPLSALSSLLKSSAGETIPIADGAAPAKRKAAPSYPKILVPLYCENKKEGRFIAKRSGLNQWNAGGRLRNSNEIYIPFPVRLRERYPDFFPPRYEPWILQLPNGKELTMAICQSDGKAIMSNPNKALGKWLLRDVLHMPEGKLITYEDLLAKGIDSLVFYKINASLFKCDFVMNGEDGSSD